MNILQIVPELHYGGVEIGSLNIATALRQQGHVPYVISHGGILLEKFIRQGTFHYTLPVHKKSIRSIVRLSRIVEKIIRDERIDIVHARSRVPAWISYLACRNLKVPWITTCHGLYSRHFGSRVMGWSDRVITVSATVAYHMISHFAVPSEKIRVVPRGIEMTEFAFQPKPLGDPIRIGLVGRVSRLKGHHLLLQALPRVKEFFPNLQVWFIGATPKKYKNFHLELLRRAADTGLKDSVFFLGGRQDIAALLKQIDLLVHPSVHPESFGRVIIEAQASGIPVIATRLGGVTEIIEHDTTGILVPSQDRKSLSEAMIRMLSSPSLRHRLTTEARKKVEQKYQLNQMISSTLNVYQELAVHSFHDYENTGY